MAHSTRPQNNLPLASAITAIFMILLAFLGFLYATNTDAFHKIQKNQQHGQQTRTQQNQDLTSITCSLWHTVVTIPSASPSPTVVQQMHRLCD